MRVRRIRPGVAVELLATAARVRRRAIEDGQPSWWDDDGDHVPVGDGIGFMGPPGLPVDLGQGLVRVHDVLLWRKAQLVVWRERQHVEESGFRVAVEHLAVATRQPLQDDRVLDIPGRNAIVASGQSLLSVVLTPTLPRRPLATTLCQCLHTEFQAFLKRRRRLWHDEGPREVVINFLLRVAHVEQLMSEGD